MTIAIDTQGRIAIDHVQTGLAVEQRKDGTLIYTPESLAAGVAYAEHKMPHERYSTAHDAPASGVAGCAQLEADLRELLADA